jgi:hypothetical protein
MGRMTSSVKHPWANAVRVSSLASGFAILILLLLFTSPLLAQLNYGRIFGGVTDATGGAIVNATVTVIDVQRGVSRPLATDSSGQYSAPSLVPGTYTVRVEANGFKRLDHQDVVVGVGQDVRVDLTLEPGEQTQTVTVTGETPEINTSNATLGGTIENEIINELPLNGRQYKNLLIFKPGVMAFPGAGTNKAMESNGTRADVNVWMFDGLYNVNTFTGQPVIGGNTSGGGPDQASILPVDAIQEVNVIENPKAEYGWKPGAQVNIGLKSGTNSIHGTAFAFGRDAALDAKNPFLLPTQPKAAVELEQFGASIGGPIKKDKLFYFGTYEGQRFLVGQPNILQVPTTAAGAGKGSSFPDAIHDMLTPSTATGNVHGAIQPSQLSLNLAGCTVVGTSATCDASKGLFGNSSPTQSDPISLNNSGGSNNYLGKIDYHLNEHNSFNGEYFYAQSDILFPKNAIQPYWVTDLFARVQVARGVWVWTPSSTWVNEARFGYDNTTLPNDDAECAKNLTHPDYGALGVVSGAQYCGFPAITISTFAALGGTNNPQTNHFGTWEASDSVSYTRGNHQFKFGGEFHSSLWGGAQRNNGTGSVSFGSVAAFPGATNLQTFLAGVPASGAILVGDPIRSIREWHYALFGQDDWRLTKRITLNLGLRWEYEPPISDARNLLGNFDPNSATGLVQVGKGISSSYNSDLNNFAPRVGIAWDVTGKGTTVVHTGIGVVYNSLTNIQNLASLGNTGAALHAIPTGFSLIAANGTALPSPGNIALGTVTLSSANIPWAVNTQIFNTTASALTCGNGLGRVNPAAATGGTNPANPPPCQVNAINPNIRFGYVTTWTLGVQHAFTNNLSANIAYVGNHGTKLFVPIDINQPVPGVKNGAAAPSSQSELIRRPYYTKFPYLSTILYYTDAEESNYDALQASLTQRVTHGLNFTAAYTYAHALDQQSYDTASVTQQDSTNLVGDYGASNFDVRHNFSLAATYTFPGKHMRGQLLEGWQVNAAVNLLSRFPYTSLDSSDDLSGTGKLQDRWDLFGHAEDFPLSNRTSVPCYGVLGSTFAPSAAGPCTAVAAGPTATPWANMPQACVTAAASIPTNPSVVSVSPAVAGATGLTQLARLGCYMEGSSVIVPPAQGTFGTMGRDVLRGKGYQQFDMSITKNWKFGERFTTQFRVEAFNVFNHTQYNLNGPSGNLGPSISSPVAFGVATSTPDSGNGVIGGGGPREIQLGLKFIF